MSAWLGPSGNLIEFAHYKGSASADLDRKVTFTETIGGGRFGQASPTTGLRTWALSATHMDPSQWAGFDLLAMGAYGDQVRFLEPLALVTNALSPLKSLPGLGGNTPGVAGDALAGGLALTEDGARVPSLLSGGGLVSLGNNAPVVPGRKITGSFYARGSAVKITFGFFDSEGAYLTGIGGLTTDAPAATLKRHSLTVTVPSGAAAAYLTVTGASVVAAPAITWTSKLMPWSRGRGCDKAVIHGISDSTVLAGHFERQQIADFDFTVTEVGDGA